MTNPTNLTDEGLRELVKDIVAKATIVLDEPIPSGTTALHFFKTERLFLSALQQVRDAAKKEEREACAKVAEKWIYYDDPTSGTDPSRHEIATAIRQMDGGK